MCGYHIMNRVTNDHNYIAMASTLKLPAACDWDAQSESTARNRGIYPEFFHSFHTTTYALDIGLLFADGAFRMMYWAGEAADPKQPEGTLWERPPIDVNFNATVELRTYLHMGNKDFVLEVWQGTEWKGAIAAHLTDDAFEEFKRGCTVHREITMATNYPDYLPSVAYFEKATFSRSTLTTTNYSYVPLSINNSDRKDPGVDQYDNETFHEELVTSYGPTPEVDDDGFVTDYGSCDFSKDY